MADNKQRGSDVVALTVPSHPKFLYVVRSAAYPVMIDAGFSRKEARRIVLALDEACSNIIRHAYEGDPEGKISLTMTVTGTELLIELRDTGKQVDVTKIAPRDLKDIRPGRLGTHFINAVFDTVRYDTSGREGTLLTLQKKRPGG